ncbi:protein ygaM [Salmonella enterica subsp. enterica]|nr:protein ygaM [Salmonella enterica subsp. enterica]
MLNKPNRNDVDDGVQDIQNDVNRLADSLEDVLKSWGSDAKDEAEAARRKAQALLKETRARMQGRTRVKQAACDAMGCADTFVREKPWCSVGTAAAVGIFIGRCLACVANDVRCRMATYFMGPASLPQAQVAPFGETVTVSPVEADMRPVSPCQRK